MKTIFIVFSVFALSLNSFQTFAQLQEICNNGVDDDGDGFVDCFDKDCANFSTCQGGYVGNDLLCEAKPSEFPKFSLALKSASLNGTANHLGRPVVGDIDGDGIPEMITINRWSKKIFILNGENVNGVNTIQREITTSYTPAFEDIAIANLRNGNGNCGEIFVLSTGWRLYAYDCNLTQLWSRQLPGDPGTIGIADFNGDGVEEIYARNAIYNAQTGDEIIPPPATGWSDVNGGPVAVDIIGDSRLELVCGGTIYLVDIAAKTLTPHTQSIANYGKKVNIDATSVADYNQDGHLDVIASGRNTTNGHTTVFFWDVHNNIVRTFSDPIPGSFTIYACPAKTSNYYENGWHQGTGRVNIADLDGDGKLNAAFVSGKYLYALKEDFTLLWKKVVNEETSGNTGCTLFDFNGDGKSEVVYRDEKNIYIIDGTNGTTFTSQTCVSRTNREYPIVADVDGDGSTELCVTCRTVDFFQNGNITDPNDPNYSKADEDNFCTLSNAEFSQVRVYKSGGEPWVPARRVWNQHGYFNVNVNDDLTIPRIQQKHHLIFSENVCTVGPNRPLNSFLNQSPFLNSLGCPKYASPDLAFVPNSLVVNPPTCPDQNFTVSFRFVNQGDIGLSGDLPITFYQGDPTQAGAIKLNTITISLTNLAVGAQFPVNNANITGPGSQFQLYIVLNDGGTTVPTPIKLPNTNFIECDYGNNIIQAPVNPLPVTIVAEKIKDNFICDSSIGVDNGAVGAHVPLNGLKNTTDFTFYWTRGASAKPIPADATGATFTGLPQGTYAVYARHNTANCNSNTATVDVVDVRSVFTVKLDTVSGVTNCLGPFNGSLKAVVRDGNGNEIANASQHFDFEWYVGDQYRNGPKYSTAQTATNLAIGTYTVGVVEKATGCLVIESADVPNYTVMPPLDANSIAKTEITCSATSKGEARILNPLAGHTYSWFNGQSAKPVADFTGTTYSNLNQGFYTVVAFNTTTRCSSDTITIQITQTVPPVITGITKDQDQISCDPSNPLGGATVTVQGNISDFDFQWYEGQTTAPAKALAGKTTPAVTGLKAMVHTVKVTNRATQCSSTAQITIGGPSAVSIIDVIPTTKTTCTPNNGRIEVTTVSSGTPADYDFFWYIGSSEKAVSDFPGNLTNVLAGVDPGSYTVKAVHRITRCVAPAKTATILENISPITINPPVLTEPTDCKSPTGVISISVTSASSQGFSFRWFAGGAAQGTPLTMVPPDDFSTATSSIKTRLVTGTYTVEVTNLQTGCSEEFPIYLPFLNGHQLTLDNQTDITTCVPNTGGSARVQLSPSPGLNETHYDVVFYDGSVDPETALPSGTVVPSEGGATPLFYSAGGAFEAKHYTFVAVVKAGSGAPSILEGCRSTLPIEIKMNTADPVIDADATAASIQNNKFCKTEVATNNGNGSITVNIGGNLADHDLLWSTGATMQTISNLKPGTYTIRATFNTPANYGCFTERSFSVLDNALQLVIEESNGDWTRTDIATCDPADGKTLFPLGTVTFNSLTVDGATFNDFTDYTFAWTRFNADGTTSAVPDNDGVKHDIANLHAGRYFVAVTDGVSNCDVTADFTIEDRTINTVFADLERFTIPTRCLQPNDVGELTVLASGTSNNGYTYNWYEGALDANGNLPPSPVGTTVGSVVLPDRRTAQNLTPGVYSVQVINNQNNCWAVEDFELPLKTFTVDITASSAPFTVCTANAQNGSVFATTTRFNHTSYQFNWWLLDNNVPATPDYTGREILNLFAGDYRVEVVDSNDPGCFATATVTVDDLRAYPTVVAAATAPLTICDPARPDGVAEANVNGQVIYHYFNWYTGATPTGASFYTGAQASGLAAATYSVIAVDMVTGCSDTTSVQIQMDQKAIPQPQIDILSMVTSCVADNGALAASVGGNTADYIFHWFIGTAAKPTPDFTGEIYDSLAVGIYSVRATSRITGCVSPLVNEEIIFDPKYPEFKFDITPATCDQNNGLVKLVVTNEVEVDDIVWSTPGGTVFGPILSEIPAGSYRVTVTSLLGCATIRDIEVTTDIHVFNGVSRNKDGRNDIFFINCIENFPTNVVKIFNRAGTLVYEAEGYDNIDIYFDGKSNKGISMMGTNLPDGTYFYIVDKRDGTKPKAGYLEIVN